MTKHAEREQKARIAIAPFITETDQQSLRVNIKHVHIKVRTLYPWRTCKRRVARSGCRPGSDAARVAETRERGRRYHAKRSGSGDKRPRVGGTRERPARQVPGAVRVKRKTGLSR